jgi:hypothetical protein
MFFGDNRMCLRNASVPSLVLSFKLGPHGFDFCV